MMEDDIAQLLADNGLYYTASAICGIAICGQAVCGRSDTGMVRVYKRGTPSSFYDSISIIGDGGTKGSTSNIRISYPHLTVIVRSLVGSTARDLLSEVQDILAENLPADINGVHYYQARPLSAGPYTGKATAGPVYTYEGTFIIHKQEVSI